jgi:hypothetical protein
MWVALMIVTGLVGASTLLARDKEVNVVLKWNPNEKQAMPAIDTTGGLFAVAIAPIADKREKGKQIGENTEQKIVVPVYSSSDVPAYLREHLVGQLKSIGLEVSIADTGDRLLKSELNEFWVSEGKNYKGTIRMKVTLTDSGGKEMWSGIVAGSSSNFGRSLKPDNYSESVSDAVQDLAATLAAAPAFRQAIARKP